MLNSKKTQTSIENIDKVLKSNSRHNVGQTDAPAKWSVVDALSAFIKKAKK